MTEPTQARAKDADADCRLDQFVAEIAEGVSRNRAQALIDAGAVRVNGLIAKAAYRLSPGDVVSVSPAGDVDDMVVRPDSRLPLRVLFADGAVVAVDKPAGQVVHPALGHTDDTLVNALLARYPDLGDVFDDERPGIVHRLDAETSGVMVVARTPEAADALRAQFKARTVDKTYLLLAKGAVSPPAGVIDAPIGRDPRQRKRMATVPDGRPAQTTYRVLESAPGYTWVEAKPRTGRTHQIRVHMAAIGFPVAGDTVYGKRDRWIDRTALHAFELAIDHPATGERMRLRADVPEDLTRALADLKIRWTPEEAAGA